jgi:hypothetical protein
MALWAVRRRGRQMVNIGVGDEAGKLPTVDEPQLALDDDGYYWFLHPLFEQLRTATGLYIDLYGDAAFNVHELNLLERMLSTARSLVEQQSESWEVHTGSQIYPVRKEVYKVVERAEFLRLLCRWEQVLERVRQTGRLLVCYGD